MSKAKEPAGWPKRLAHLQRSGRLSWFKTATEWSSAYGLIQNLNEKGFDRETRSPQVSYNNNNNRIFCRSAFGRYGRRQA